MLQLCTQRPGNIHRDRRSDRRERERQRGKDRDTETEIEGELSSPNVLFQFQAQLGGPRAEGPRCSYFFRD